MVWVNFSATSRWTYTRSAPIHDCPALDIACQRVTSAARLISASRSISTGSFPPHSSTTGVIRSAQVAATFLAVRVEPVKEIFPTALSVRAIPVSGVPVTTVKISAKGAMRFHVSPSQAPIAGVNSLGLKTTVFPAASAYAIDPIGVKTG